MPIPAHLRIEYRGTFGAVGSTPIEEWSFSLRHTAQPDFDTPAEMVPLAASAAEAYRDNIAAIMPDNVVLRSTRVSSIVVSPPLVDATHVQRTASGELVQAVDETPSVGTDGPINAPPQLAVCVSLVTARAGATGKGRFYLPMPAMVPSIVDRRLSNADAAQVANAAAGLVTDLNGALGFGSVAVISSKGHVSNVTAVRCGRAVDTIRSRRTSLVEDYVTVAV